MEFHNLQPSGPRSRGRLAVVSGYAHNALTPRGQRTQQLLQRLRGEWEIELIALPEDTFKAGDQPRPRRRPWRKAAGGLVDVTLLDKWEPWSLRWLSRWSPEADAALLITYPWAPVTYAARRLRRAGIPYVLDAGDPWGLTAPFPIGGLLTRRRYRRAERQLWRGAAGAVVTTPQQAEVLTGLFPSLPVLVRPNGYEPPSALPQGEDPAAPDPQRLRLVHYGSLPHLRVDVTRLLETLMASGRWRSIQLTQFGDDYEGMLRRAPAGVEIEWRAPRPWGEVLAEARAFDLAIAIGNVLPGQLPSKAIQYMTLPIPRLAVTVQGDGDALGEYVRDRPGWAAVEWDDPGADRVVWDHLSSDWSSATLEPPREEAWPAVTARIVDFVDTCVARERDRSMVSYAGARPQEA